MTTRSREEQPHYGDVERDNDSGALVMWIAPDIESDRPALWTCLVLDPGTDPTWNSDGDYTISGGVSLRYRGWVKVETA